jgi:hypothetical protein
LTSGASASDIVEIIAYDIFSVADTVSASKGGTFSGALTVDADGTTVATFDRATSDGAIVDLQKDGTTVGSIGVANGDNLYIAVDDTTDVGIKFDGDANEIYPCNASGGVQDNVVTLGDSVSRFKNLYLSGGVYVGGTGSANYLDDYEEGTWTPTDFNGNSWTSNVTATYRKIGNTVFWWIDISHNGSITSANTLAGFPFTSSNTGGNYAGYHGYTTDNQDIVFHLNKNSTNGALFVGSANESMTGRLIMAGSYPTDA